MLPSGVLSIVSILAHLLQPHLLGLDIQIGVSRSIRDRGLYSHLKRKSLIRRITDYNGGCRNEKLVKSRENWERCTNSRHQEQPLVLQRT